MDIHDFKSRVEAVDWHQFDGPQYYDAGKVPLALVALAQVEKEDYSRIVTDLGPPPNILMNCEISSKVMFAIGNDHAGSYYPAAFKALEFIAEVAIHGNTVVARNCAINAMIDLYYFGFDDGQPVATQWEDKEPLMKSLISSYNTQLLKNAETEDKRNRDLILDFTNGQKD